jgi:hypothetical protein
MIEPAYAPAGPVKRSHGPRAARITRALFGVDCLDWQRFTLDHALALDEYEPGRWRFRYRTVVVTVARQNGKSVLLRGATCDRMVGMDGTTAAVMSQDRAAAKEIIFEPIADAFEDDRWSLMRPKVRRSNGFERVLLGALDSRLVLLSPTEKGAHGYSLDVVVVDEAWSLWDFRVPQAVTPTQVARPDPQLWVVSTAGTEQSLWLRQLVDSGRAGAEGLAYFEWSAPLGLEADDPAAWRAANPSLEQTITLDALADARAKLPENEFERAHLNRWTVAAEAVIPAALWATCHAPDLGELSDDGVVFGFDVAHDRGSAAIAASSITKGRVAVELTDIRPGTEWLIPRLIELRDRWSPAAIAANNAGPARNVIEAAPAAGLALDAYNAGQYVTACQTFYDLVAEGRLAHRGQGPLDLAVAGAGRRNLSGSWAFGRSPRGGDIAPLVAAALAAYRSSRPHLLPVIVTR